MNDQPIDGPRRVGRRGNMDVNSSSASVQARILALAALDWAHAPKSVIKEELGDIGYASIVGYRGSDLYKQTIEEFKRDWIETQAKLPETSSLRKQVQWAFSIAMKRLVEILSNQKTAKKDIISAARLVAQMDGRFLKPGDEPSMSPDKESVAAELLKAMARDKNSVM